MDPNSMFKEIPLLDNTNYDNWSRGVKDILIYNGLEYTIEHPNQNKIVEKDASDSFKKERMARSIINLKLPPGLQREFEDYKTPLALWNAIKEQFGKLSEASVMVLIKDLMNSQLGDSTSIQDRIRDIKDKRKQLSKALDMGDRSLLDIIAKYSILQSANIVPQLAALGQSDEHSFEKICKVAISAGEQMAHQEKAFKAYTPYNNNQNKKEQQQHSSNIRTNQKGKQPQGKQQHPQCKICLKHHQGECTNTQMIYMQSMLEKFEKFMQAQPTSSKTKTPMEKSFLAHADVQSESEDEKPTLTLMANFD